MKPEHKPLVAFAAVVVGIAVLLGVYFSAQPTDVRATLPIPAGTVIHLRPDKFDPGQYVLRFSLTEPGRIVGGWSTQRGTWIYIDWANHSNTRRAWIVPPLDVPWNATVNQTFVPGEYVMSFSGYGYDNVTITKTIQIVYPGGTNATHFYWDQSGLPPRVLARE